MTSPSMDERKAVWKRVVAWAPCHALYWLGHWTSLAMDGPQARVLYPVYNNLMLTSRDLSDWAGLGIWKPAPTPNDDMTQLISNDFKP